VGIFSPFQFGLRVIVAPKIQRMRKLLLFVTIAVMPWVACLAQPSIDGVWKTDPRTVTGASKPSKYFVDANEYRCESCAPKIKVPADGQPHALKGNPYIDHLSARVVDDHTFEVTSVAGKISTTGRMTISADGRSMVREITSREANGTTSATTETLTRVGAAPKHGHAVSGTWKFATVVKMTDETITFKMTSGILSMNASDGSGYDAPMDGTKVPFRNSPGIDWVSVVVRGGNTIEEVSYEGDKPVWVNTMVLAADGSKMKISWDDKLRGAKGSFTMLRQ
jgi:hypothetical protein